MNIFSSRNKQRISFILALIMVLLVLPTSVWALNQYPTITVGNAANYCDETVDVTLTVSNNPGIAAMKLNVLYDDTALELIDVIDGVMGGSLHNGLDAQTLSQNPYTILWEDSLSKTNNCSNGALATLKFKIKDTAVEDDYPIYVVIDEIIDAKYKDISFNTVSGSVTSKGERHCIDLALIPLDCNTKQEIISVKAGEKFLVGLHFANNRLDEYTLCTMETAFSYDSTKMQSTKRVEYGVVMSLAAENMDSDGIITCAAAWPKAVYKIGAESTSKEIATEAYIWLFEFTAKEDLYYNDLSKLSFVYEYTDPNTGITYYDATCGAYNGEILSVDTNFHIHNIVTDNAIVATCTVAGLTEGLHCSGCGMVFVSQTAIKPLGHSTGSAVEENRVESSCSKDGSYDMVEYCEVCGEELSRKSYTIPAIEHEYMGPSYFWTTNSSIASCEAVRVCSNNAMHVEREYATVTSLVALEATCTHTGVIAYTATYKNTVFETQYHNGVINKTKHQYENGVCTVCGEKDPYFEASLLFDSEYEEKKVRPGDTFTVDLVILRNKGVVSFQGNIEYDSSVMELVSCSDKAILPKKISANTNKNPIVIRWQDALADDNQTTGTAVTLTFKLLADIQIRDYQITLSEFSAFNNLNEEYEGVCNSATVKTIEFYAGDVNNDGKITVLDATYLLNYFDGKVGYETIPFEESAEVDGHNKITINDVVAILRHVANWKHYEILPYMY